METTNLFKLLIAIGVSLGAGVIGSFFTAPSIASWYVTLSKPTFTPPAWVFGPVWTTLFVLMGIAAFLVWKKGWGRVDVKIALGIFIGQLVLNTLWSIIFFGLHAPGAALIEIIFLWFAILGTIVAFAKISKLAAWLLVPYILWVTFAGYLNFSIWQLHTPDSSQIACTQEAKQCPDGSYVGRTGPACEFAPCPEAHNNSWKTMVDEKTGISFQYPETLPTTYIHMQDWPPQLQVLNESFTCTEAGLETARAGKTEKRVLANRTYCRTSSTEGAAGSIYTQYAYAFPLYSTDARQTDGKVAIFTFTTRTPQCDNYDDPQRTACKNEQKTFDLDSIVDRMAQSIVVR